MYSYVLSSRAPCMQIQSSLTVTVSLNHHAAIIATVLCTGSCVYSNYIAIHILHFKTQLN